jgi:hypothetical protein
MASGTAPLSVPEAIALEIAAFSASSRISICVRTEQGYRADFGETASYL